LDARAETDFEVAVRENLGAVPPIALPGTLVAIDDEEAADAS
jgi:hypothetical protein